MTAEHVPVMLRQCIDALDIRPDGTYVDCTFGRGGHSRAILQRLHGGRLVALDRDEEAIASARELEAEYPGAFTAVHSEYSHLADTLGSLGITSVNGILFDLGVSSPQLDQPDRGFSYLQDAPLDMRMDRTQSLTAADVVNGYDYEELKRILFDFGEERYAPNIARAIVKARGASPITTTGRLAQVVTDAMPSRSRKEKQHPARRTFQAVRIAVNSELTLLQKGLDAAISVLAPGGMLAVITFHSLEDRIVKNAIRDACTGCICPKSFPVCVCGRVPLMEQTGKPSVPDREETETNPRARSARLRTARKL